MKIDKREWPESKIRDYYPWGPEKVTFVAIAQHMKYTTAKAIVSRYRLATDIGKSVRTVQRHIVKLEKLAYLIVERQGKYEHRSSVYRIPMCSFTSAELFFMLAFSPGKWMRCIIDPSDDVNGIWVEGQLRTVLERQWETKRLAMQDRPTGKESQADSPPNDLKQEYKTTGTVIAPEVLDLIQPIVGFDWESHLKFMQKNGKPTTEPVVVREIRSREEIESDLAALEAAGYDTAALRERHLPWGAHRDGV